MIFGPSDENINFTLNASELIEEAFDLCGIGSEGEPINADMQARGLRSLNLLLKTWGTSEHLWLRTERTVTLVAGQAAYTLDPKPKRVIEGRRKVISSGIETPLTSWARKTYTEQPNKLVQSIPTAFYYDPQKDEGTLYVWPSPSASTASTTQLVITYLRTPEDFDSSGDAADVPQEWLQTLTYSLAAELGLKYEINGQRLARIEARAMALMAKLEAFDTEPESLFLQPEWQ